MWRSRRCRRRYLAEGTTKGVRVCISSVRRFDASAIPTTVKACGQYVNSVRAVQEALRRGFDEAIFLNQRGEVAEGSGENLFLVQGDTIVTNDEDAGVLPASPAPACWSSRPRSGSRRASRRSRIEDLRSADELFFTGTAVEVTPIRDVDGHRWGWASWSDYLAYPKGLLRRGPRPRRTLPPLAGFAPPGSDLDFCILTPDRKQSPTPGAAGADVRETKRRQW